MPFQDPGGPAYDLKVSPFQYSLAYACLKLVNYSVFFWLPYYLNKNFGWEDTVSAEVSSYYDWGGVVGGTIGGIVSVSLLKILSLWPVLIWPNVFQDLLGKRAPVVSTQLIFSVAAFGVYTRKRALRPLDHAIYGLDPLFSIP